MRIRKKMAAVYMIQNMVNFKKYIGGTNDFTRRKGTHRFDLRNNKHHSKELQDDWNMMGENSFKFSILVRVENTSEIKTVEQEWIDRIIPEYNISKYSDSTKGTSRSDETKNKMREAASRKTYKAPSGKDAFDSKAMNQYDMNGIFLRRFESLKDAERAGFGFVNKFSACCKGKLKSYKGYKYKYVIGNTITGASDTMAMEMVDRTMDIFKAESINN